jgi:hypothetical protein
MLSVFARARSIPALGIYKVKPKRLEKYTEKLFENSFFALKAHQDSSQRCNLWNIENTFAP